MHTRFKTQVPMRSNGTGCPKNSSTLCFSFLPVITSVMHLESESKKWVKNADFHTAKNIPKQATLFLHFYTNSHNLTWKLFPVVWSQKDHQKRGPTTGAVSLASSSFLHGCMSGAHKTGAISWCRPFIWRFITWNKVSLSATVWASPLNYRWHWSS